MAFCLRSMCRAHRVSVGCFDDFVFRKGCPSLTHLQSNRNLTVVFQADQLNKGTSVDCARGEDNGVMRSARGERDSALEFPQEIVFLHCLLSADILANPQ